MITHNVKGAIWRLCWICVVATSCPRITNKCYCWLLSRWLIELKMLNECPDLSYWATTMPRTYAFDIMYAIVVSIGKSVLSLELECLWREGNMGYVQHSVLPLLCGSEALIIGTWCHCDQVRGTELQGNEVTIASVILLAGLPFSCHDLDCCFVNLWQQECLENITTPPQGWKGEFWVCIKSWNKFKINSKEDLEEMTFIKLSRGKKCLRASLFTLLDSEARFAKEKLTSLNPEEEGHRKMFLEGSVLNWMEDQVLS